MKITDHKGALSALLLLAVVFLFHLLAACPTPLQRTTSGASPRKPARAKEGLALVLVLDRSGSMSGYKLDLAKKLIVRLLERLRSTDHFGLIQFAKRPIVVWDLQRKSEHRSALASVHRIAVDKDADLEGAATDFVGALRAASTMLHPLSQDTFFRRHVLFITDGHGPVRGALAAARKLTHDGTTLSILVLPPCMNVPVLKKMAAIGQGRYWTVTESKLDVWMKELQLLGR